VTNNHVVEDAEKIEVTFYDGVTEKATVVGNDKHTDVAVIKVEKTSYPPLPKGDSQKLKVGQLVMAVGSPFELSQSVTSGIISALDRNNLRINGADAYESFIQTDAAINRGNSGGPLLNMDGQVIGVNSAILTGGSSGNDGIGFAIPINMAGNVADMLIKEGKVHYARIGIALDSLTPALARALGVDESTKGVAVGHVVPGSPAEKAGLQQGDIITGFAGEKVHDISSFRIKVATSEVAKAHEIEFLRDGKRRTTMIVPAPAEKVVFDSEDNDQSVPQGREPAKPARSSINEFGLEVQPLTPDLARQLNVPTSLKGLVVTSVKEGSPAEAERIQEGDVITKVIRNHKIQPLTDVKEFNELASSSDELALVVQSGKLSRFVTLTKAAK
jgi:serine protease Do